MVQDLQGSDPPRHDAVQWPWRTGFQNLRGLRFWLLNRQGDSVTQLHVLYRFFDADDNLLYVGITNSPLARMGQHLRDKAWFKHAARTTYEHFKTRADVEAAEVKAIR